MGRKEGGMCASAHSCTCAAQPGQTGRQWAPSCAGQPSSLCRTVVPLYMQTETLPQMRHAHAHTTGSGALSFFRPSSRSIHRLHAHLTGVLEPVDILGLGAWLGCGILPHNLVGEDARMGMVGCMRKQVVLFCAWASMRTCSTHAMHTLHACMAPESVRSIWACASLNKGMCKGLT